MFIDNNPTWREKRTKTVSVKCTKCGNTAENVVMGAFTSAHVGFVFLPKKMQLGKRKYYLVCPVCGNANKEISSEQVKALKI